MTKSQILFYFCLSFIGGVMVDSFFYLSPFIKWGILLLGILLVLLFFVLKKWKIVLVGFCVLFLVAGVLRHQAALLRIVNSDLTRYSGQAIVLDGRVIKEPDVREDSIKLTIETERLKHSGTVFRNVKGKVLITANRYPEYFYGDRVEVKGRLETPQVFEGFNYKNYLAKDGIYSVMYYPKIELISRKDYQGLIPTIYAKVLFFKDKLRSVIYQNLSPPQSSILGAMILGDKSRISKNFKEKLNSAGVRHITAISGMHVAILTSILMSFLIGLGLWRAQAFYITVFIISFFIIITGLQPSAIRAGIMGGLFLFAQHVGRMNGSFRILFLAAALMLIQNPLLLRLDVGFQLSFLAMLGIIELGSIVRDWLKFLPNSFQLRDILSMTLSAQFFTFPILIYNFGYLSLVSPLANILVVPLLPLILGLGFLFALFGVIWSELGWVLSLPLWFFLSYITKIVNFFSGFSFSSLTLEISWPWILIVYLFLGIITWRLQESKKLKFLRY